MTQLQNVESTTFSGIILPFIQLHLSAVCLFQRRHDCSKEMVAVVRQEFVRLVLLVDHLDQEG